MSLALAHTASSKSVSVLIFLVALYAFMPSQNVSSHFARAHLQTYLSNSGFQHAAENGELLEVASLAGEVLNV